MFYYSSSFPSILTLAGGQIGVVASPLIGGALTEYATWRWCAWYSNPQQQCPQLLRNKLGFYINLPIGGLAVLFLLFISLPEHGLNRPEQRLEIEFASLFSELDIMGFLLLSPTLVMFLLALEWGGTTYPWNNAMVIGLFCGSAGNLVFLLIWEYTNYK